MNRPWDRSYWVDEKLLAGQFPGDPTPEGTIRRMEALWGVGIRAIVNLMEPDEVDHEGRPFREYAHIFSRVAGMPVDVWRHPIPDLGVTRPENMVMILDHIDELMERDWKVYVHCWGGVGRTGTVVGCWLIRHGVVDAAGVIEKIRQLRQVDAVGTRPSPETAAQRRMVLAWKKGE